MLTKEIPKILETTINVIYNILANTLYSYFVFKYVFVFVAVSNKITASVV
jgi:hypothetical protein